MSSSDAEVEPSVVPQDGAAAEVAEPSRDDTPVIEDPVKPTEHVLLPELTVCHTRTLATKYFVYAAYFLAACKLLVAIGGCVVFSLMVGFAPRINMGTLILALCVTFFLLMLALRTMDRNYFTAGFLIELYILATCVPLIDFAMAIARRKATLESMNIPVDSDQSADYAYAAMGGVSFALAFFSAWVNFRLRERIIEENIRPRYDCESQYTLEGRAFATLVVIRVFACVQIFFSIIICILALTLHSAKWKQLGFLGLTTFVCAVLILTNGAVFHCGKDKRPSRYLFFLVVSYMIWDMSKFQAIAMDFYSAKQRYWISCEADGCQHLATFNGVVAVVTLDAFVVFTLAFLCFRMTDILADLKSKAGESAPRIFGYRRPEVVAAVFFGFTVFTFFYGILLTIVSSTVDGTGLAAWFGPCVAVATLFSTYGVLERNRGFMLTTVILVQWSIASAWWFLSYHFETVARANAVCKATGFNCNQKKSVGMGLCAVYIMLGLILATLALVLTEEFHLDKVRENTDAGLSETTGVAAADSSDVPESSDVVESDKEDEE